MPLRPCCKTGHHLICNSGISEARKAPAQAVKMTKECSWEEFGRRLDFNYSLDTKYLGKRFAACVGKVYVPQPPSRI